MFLARIKRQLNIGQIHLGIGHVDFGSGSGLIKPLGLIEPLLVLGQGVFRHLDQRQSLQDPIIRLLHIEDDILDGGLQILFAGAFGFSRLIFTVLEVRPKS